MCVEETISPSTSTSGTTRASNASWRRSSVGVARGPVAEAEVLAHRHALAPAAARPARESMNSCGPLRRERAVERDHDELAHPEAGDQVGLDVERGQQLGRGVGRHDRARVRLEGEHGVGAVDHLAVAEVHAVELADRDVARAALGIGEPGDLHVARNPTTGLSSAVRPRLGERDQAVARRAAARCPSAGAGDGHAVPRAARRVARERHRGQEVERVAERHDPLRVGVGDVEVADRGAAQLEAVGVAEVGDQRAHVGARAALDRERGAVVLAAGAARSA